MSFKTLLAATTAALIAMPAFAGPQISIENAYARAAGAMAVAGAAFFTIRNTGDEDDRLVAAKSDAAKMVQLHTHIAEGDVMRMVEVPEGFPVPAGGTHELKRGGDHVMMMGLKAPFVDGESIDLTLVFEKSGPIEISVPVDNAREDGAGMSMTMSN
ncbi:MAG: copper chaperone PCu(A)C [Alphaproteobacteria bacterium]|nr:MAG: copper chaperone PCu(A)C [Alphaproteobacteria bacterium]